MSKAKKLTPPSKDNVISMTKAATDPASDRDLMHLRAFAALRALDKVHGKLTAALALANSAWAGKAKTAMTEVLTPIRAEYASIGDYDPSSKSKKSKAQADDYANKFVAVGHSLIDYDKIKAEWDADKKARNKIISRVSDALAECKNLSKKSSAQGDMFGDEDLGIPAGMSWATPATRETIYTALLRLEEDGVQLDDYQAQLLGDLGTEGLDTFDLGLAAADAIETESGGSEAPPADQGDDEDPDEMGF